MSETNPLLTLLHECVVRIDCDGEFRGSGFFVAPGQVLTCAHVVHDAEKVAVSGVDWQSEAGILAALPELEQGSPDARFYPPPDLALLTVEEPPPEHRVVRLADEEPAAGASADVLHLYGYSLGEYGSESVNPSAASVEYRGPLGVPRQTLFKLGGDQVLRGYSGCPVLNLRTGSVCGVIDSTRDATSDLGGFGVPVATIAESLPGLLERNREDAERMKTWKEAVEAERAAAARREDIVGLPLLPPMIDLQWVPDSPQSQLLKPRFGVVELLEREQLQAHLMHWREGPDQLRVLLVTGGGGFGKTRLVLEECARAKRAGWSAGLLTIDHDASVDRALQQLAEWPERLYVAIDYAETRPSLVSSLLLRLSRRIGGPPVRLVLVCRQVQSRKELEELFATGDGNDEVGQALSRAEPVRLDQHTLDSRRLFEIGREAFARHLEVEPLPARIPSLREPHFERPLFVLAAALLAAQDPDMDIDSMSQNGLMLELIDRHESQYWNRLSDELGTGLDKPLQARAVAVATALGAETEQEALGVAGVVLGSEATAERRRSVARWLSHLYSDGRLDKSPSIAPVEPDMLAEALVGREYTACPELLDASLEDVSESQLERALGVFTKASSGRPQLSELFRAALDRHLPRLAAGAVAAGGELVSVLDLAVSSMEPAAGAVATLSEVRLERVGGGLLRASVARVAGAQARQILENEPSENARGLLAGSLTELSIALSERGQALEALEAAEEAVELRRELVVEGGEKHAESLAGALNNLSNRLDELGRPGALEVIEECLALRRELAAKGVDNRADLAGGLNNLAGVFGNLGEKERALEAVEEATALYRALAAEDPDRYLADLAMAQNNSSVILGNLGKPEEALAAAEEAVGHYRSLAAANPAHHLPGLTVALNNLSTVLPDLRREAEALKAAEEAVKHLRVLVARDPDAFLDELSGTLNNLSNLLEAQGRWEEALEGIEEAVDGYRILARHNPDRYQPDLAMSLSNMANRLSDAGRKEEALRSIREAVDTYRVLVERNPDRYLPEIAVALSNMASTLGETRQFVEALKVGKEAVAIQRKLAGERGAVHHGELATSLTNLSVILSMHGQKQEAREAAEEAVELYRVLAAGNPGKYHPELAGSLINMAVRLFDSDRAEDALEVAEEAVRHLRALTAQNRPRHLPDLMTAMNNLARMLNVAGRDEQALEVSEEVIAQSRPLAKKNPGRYLIDFCVSLSNLVEISAKADRADQAKATLDAILEEHGTPTPTVLLFPLGNWHALQGQLDRAVKIGGDAWKETSQRADLTLQQEARSFLFRLRDNDEARFDELWRQEIGDEMPLWLRYPRTDKELLELLLAWVELPPVEESRSFLTSHPEILTDPYEAALDNLAHRAPHPQVTFKLEILRAARREGIPAAYQAVEERLATLERRQRLEEWVNVGSGDLPEFLRDHQEELFRPMAEEELASALLDNPGDNRILLRLGLLGLAKSAGPSFLEVANEGLRSAPSDEECADVTQADRLPLTRLRAAAKSDDPEAQLQHAIAAAAAGLQVEALQAISRCGRLLPSWEINEYQRRLEDLATSSPNLDGLREVLTSSGEEASG